MHGTFDSDALDTVADIAPVEPNDNGPAGRFQRYVKADEEQNDRLRKSLAAWGSCSGEGHARQHIIHQAVKHLDSLGEDPEVAHGKLDEWLMVFAPDEVRDAAQRLMARCEWWAGA
ncbi:hypothetical protein UB45_07710 [Terrabacter sp. 28]|nr:hypothetical protein UB45_07710 [Terrabacter sp. 28]